MSTKVLFAFLMVIIVLPLIGQETDIVLETLQSPPTTIVFTEDQQKELSSKMLEYEIFVRQHTMDVFEWDLMTTKSFFVMVIVITGIGIFFAIRNINKVAKLEVDPKGINIKGTIGLVLLLLSLAFCYLYMKTIYPIYTVPPL